MGLASGLTKNLRKGILKEIKEAQSALGKDQSNPALKTKLKELKVEVEDAIGPVAKFKADRKVDPAILEAIKKQEKPGANRTPVEGKAAFKQTPAEKAADKTTKTTTPRTANAKGNLTSAQMKTIDDAPTPQALTSVQAKMIEAINKLKKLTPAERKTRIANVRKRITKRKIKLREDAVVKSKKEDTRKKSERGQSAQERLDSKIGNESATTSQKSFETDRSGRPTISMADQRSFTNKLLSTKTIEIEKAIRELNKVKQTSSVKSLIKGLKARLNKIKKIDAAPRNKMELRSSLKASDNSKRGQAVKAAAIKKMTDEMKSTFGSDVMAEGRAARLAMNKGGMSKKKSTSTAYAYGGMAKAKPRTGNTDYRMGGMFMKNGKK